MGYKTLDAETESIVDGQPGKSRALLALTQQSKPKNGTQNDSFDQNSAHWSTMPDAVRDLQDLAAARNKDLIDFFARNIT